jgi:hypothetical protein
MNGESTQVRMIDPNIVKSLALDVKARVAEDEALGKETPVAIFVPLVVDAIIPLMLDIRILLTHALNALAIIANNSTALVAHAQQQAEEKARGMIDPRILRG